MKKFFEKWLGAICVLITIAFFTFYGGRASQESVDKLDKKFDDKVETLLTIVNDNAVQIGKLTGYIDAKAEKK